MAYWRFSPYEQLKAAAFRAMRVGDTCPACEAGTLVRIAIRENFRPWSWQVAGFTCNTCFAIFAEGPRGLLV